MDQFGRKKEENATEIPSEAIETGYQKARSAEVLQRERAKKELDLLRKELDETAAILDSTLSRLDNLRNEYYSKSGEIDSLNEELERKRNEVRSIRVEYNLVKSEFDRLNSELEPLRSQSEMTRKEATAARKELEFIQKELASVDQLDRTKKIAQVAGSLVASLNSRYEELKKELGIVLAALSRTREENYKLKEERSGFPEIDQHLLDAKSKLEFLQFQQQIKKKELDEAKREMSFIQKELASLYARRDVVAKAEETPQFVSQIKTFIEKDLASRYDEIRKELELVHSELAKLRQVYEEEEKKSMADRMQTQLDKPKSIASPQMVEEYQTYTKSKFEILLQPVGLVPVNVTGVLQKMLTQQFRSLKFVLAARSLALPTHLLDTSRNQFRSPQIISWIEENCRENGFHKILGICDAIAYSGRLNFVFGEAQLDGMVAVVYLNMFRSELEGSRASEELFLQRALKETVHELGHIFGLEHCTQRTCAMYFSNSLAETDFKKNAMCDSCMKILEQTSD
jgi:archaemetzincin